MSLSHLRLLTGTSLVQVAKAQHERSYQNKLWLLHWHSRIHHLAASCSTVSNGEDQSDKTSHEHERQRQAAEEEIERCKGLMTNKRDEIPRLEAKQAHAEAALKIVLPRCAALLHPTICSELYAKLPRELRNMIYSYIDTFTDDIQVEHSTKGTKGVPTSAFFDGDCSTHAWDKPWYFDPSCIGHDLAREMVELQYSKSIFRLNDDALIPRLLNEDRWKTGAVPRNHIRQIELEVLDEQEFEDELAQLRLKDNIVSLRQLTAGAKISINLFNLAPSSYDGSRVRKEESSEKHGLETTAARLWSSMGQAIDIYAKLETELGDPNQNGHRIVFLDQSTRDIGKLSN